MKKCYLSVSLAILSLSVFAQTTHEKTQVQNLGKNKFYHHSQMVASDLSKAAPFFTDNFDTPSDWTMTDIANGGAQNWVIGTNGPVGTYSGSLGAITSTSGGNFAMYDSDALNTAYSPQNAILAYDYSIDCSAYPYVNINFESYHKMFHDSVFVEVSNDNVNWDRYRVHAAQSANDVSANPEYVSINISATAGGQSTVWFRFHYEGEWDYAWMLDDVSFSETPSNKLTISDETIGGWWIGYQTAGGMGLDYIFNPMNQVAANPYRFEAVLHNEGLATQNTTLKVEVLDDIMTSVANLSSANNTLSMGMVDTFATTASFTPANTGLYYFNMWGEGDSAITDTTYLASIVTDTVYGRDWGQEDGYWRVGRSCGGMVLGVDFDMYVSDDLSSVSAFINSNSVAGANIFGAIYEVDPQGDPIWLAQTDDYPLKSTDLGNWVTIPFAGGQTLSAGTAYMIAIGGYAHPIDTVAISTSGVGQGATCHIQDNGCNLGTAGFGAWYYITSIPMIRMNFGSPISGIQEMAFNGKLSVYPNPTQGVFTIEMNGVEQDNYTIKVSNVLGQKVMEKSVEVNNLYNESFDLSALEKGVYIVDIKNSSAIVTERIVIE